MADPTVVDVILYRDGDNLIMQSSNSSVRIRLAFVDTGGAEAAGEGQITALLQGQSDQAETSAFLDSAKVQVETFIQTGGLERERENIRLRNLLEERGAANVG